MIILHKRETGETLKITGLSVYVPTCTNCSFGYYKNEWKRVWMKTNQENRLFSERLLSRCLYQIINQLIEICNGYKRPLCVGYIDYEKAFDFIEYEAVLRH